MAGRSVSRARFEAEQLRIAEARQLPTEPRAQPISYTADLDAEIIALASLGLMPAEIAAHWAISEEELKDWQEAHSSFRDAARRARTRAKAWWQRQPRQAISEGNNKFPAGAWAQQVRAMFPEYDDKTSATVHIDLGSLVVIQRAEPPGKRTDAEPSALIEHATVRLAGSQTARNERLAPMSAPSGDPGSGLSSDDPASHETDQPGPAFPRAAG